MSLSGPKWTSNGWSSLTVGGATPGAMPIAWPSSPIATITAGGRLDNRLMPSERRPLRPLVCGRANVGVIGAQSDCKQLLPGHDMQPADYAALPPSG